VVCGLISPAAAGLGVSAGALISNITTNKIKT